MDEASRQPGATSENTADTEREQKIGQLILLEKPRTYKTRRKTS